MMITNKQKVNKFNFSPEYPPKSLLSSANASKCFDPGEEFLD